MTYLSRLEIRSFAAAGSFLKAYSDLGGIKTYYKLSNYDSVRGVTGHECINECRPLLTPGQSLTDFMDFYSLNSALRLKVDIHK